MRSQFCRLKFIVRCLYGRLRWIDHGILFWHFYCPEVCIFFSCHCSSNCWPCYFINWLDMGQDQKDIFVLLDNIWRNLVLHSLSSWGMHMVVYCLQVLYHFNPSSSKHTTTLSHHNPSSHSIGSVIRGEPQRIELSSKEKSAVESLLFSTTSWFCSQVIHN